MYAYMRIVYDVYHSHTPDITLWRTMCKLMSVHEETVTYVNISGLGNVLHGRVGRPRDTLEHVAVFP